jgi:tetratricopeptide (TPR) repeat protein
VRLIVHYYEITYIGATYIELCLGKRYARAQRSIARFHVKYGRWPEAIEAFEKALELNPLYKDAWLIKYCILVLYIYRFTLGVGYMQIQDYTRAITPFTRVLGERDRFW